jgi:hypothetical protein
MPNQLGKGRFRPWLHPKLRRPSDAERRVFREGLIKADIAFLADDRFQFFGNDQVRRERRKLLVNVACAKTQDQVARSDHIANIAMESVQSRLVTDSAMAMRRDFVGNRLAADPFERSLAGWIDIGYHDAIGVIESASKLAA